MSYRDEQLSKYVNNIYHLNEKNAVGRAIDELIASGKKDDEIRAMNPYYAQELDRRASNINVQDYANKVGDARKAAEMAQSLANVHQNDKYDAAADKARANVVGAQNDLENAKVKAKANVAAKMDAKNQAADLEAYRAEKREQAKLYKANLELEQTKQELEQAKKELEELKAKAAQGDTDAAQEAEKVKDVVEQKTEEVKEETAEVKNAKTETTPPTAEELNAGAETTATQTSPEETAKAQANAEETATQSAMEIKPTDTPEIQQAKQNFQQEWADLKTQIGSIQDTTKKLMSSPIATSYVKQRPDLATKFQKFGGALAAMGSIVGLAGMITMFINPALGGILSAAGRTMVGAGGATASGANAVKQFKNGNVLGGIGSLAAAGMSGAMAGMGAKSLAGGIGAMQAANAAPAVSTETTDAMAGDPRFAAPTDTNPANGNTTQSFTPGSNPAQFTNREPTIANTNDAVANAQPGDVLQRNDGTRIEINQGDIDWAKAHQSQPVPQVTPQVGAQTVNTGTLSINPNAGTPNLGNITLPNGPLQPNLNAFKAQTQPSPLFNSSTNPFNPTPNLGNIKAGSSVLQPNLNDYNAFKTQTQPSPLFNSSTNPFNPTPNLGDIKAGPSVLQPNLNDYNAFKAQTNMNLPQGVNVGGNTTPNLVPSSWSQPHQPTPNVKLPYVQNGQWINK